MDGAFYGFVVLLFGAIILLIEGLYLWWNSAHGGGAQRIARRLKVLAASAGSKKERISILKKRRFSGRESWDQVLHRHRFFHRIDKLLIQAGMTASVTQFLAWCAAGFLAGLLLSGGFPMPTMARLGIAVTCMQQAAPAPPAAHRAAAARGRRFHRARAAGRALVYQCAADRRQ
jgi:tight adherence protein B